MSCSKWAYDPKYCDGEYCVGDCDLCDKPKVMPEFEKCNSDGDIRVEKCDYIKRDDAARAMAQYMMDTALIDNPEASDRIEEWEGSIAAPVMSTVEAADVVEVVRCRDCKHWHDNTEFCDFWSGLNVAQRTISTSYCSYGERAEE